MGYGILFFLLLILFSKSGKNRRDTRGWSPILFGGIVAALLYFG